MSKYYGNVEEGERTASYKGIALKTLYFIGLAILSALVSAWVLFTYPALALIMMFVAMGGALVCALITAFVPRAVKITGSLYALFQGFLVGVISAVVGAAYGGIVLAALLATLVTLAIMMILYYTGIVKVTQKFRSVMITALISMVLVNLVMFVVGWFVPAVWQLFYGNNIFAILVSALMTVLAALFLLIDLDNITKTVQMGLKKDAEWYAAFGLTVTLIWLYMEFLRLFARIASRR